MDHAPSAPEPVSLSDVGRLSPVILYWQSLRQGRIVPARTDLDPMALQPWLSASGILARDDEGRVRFRLAGRVLAGLVGTEPRGLPFRAAFAPAARPRLAGLLAQVFEAPAVLRLSLLAPAASRGATPATVDMAILPLADGEGRVRRALVSVDLDPREMHGQSCRLEIRQAAITPLRGPGAVGVRIRRGAAPALRVIQGGRD